MTYTTYRIDQSLVGISKNFKKSPQLLKHAPIRLGTSLGRKSTLLTHPSHEVRGREPLMAPPTKCTKQQGGSALAATTSHLKSCLNLAPWNSLPTKNFGKFQKHLSSIIQPIPVHPFRFPAVFNCCEQPLICPCLWKIHWTTGHLTQLLCCLWSLQIQTVPTDRSNNHSLLPSTSIYLCLLQRLSHLSPLASAPPCPAWQSAPMPMNPEA